MYIAPISDIILLKSVPIDPDYNNTIYFPDATTQANYFQSNFTYKRFTNQMYQRKDRNYLRVRVPCDQVFDYNYMMFRNGNGSNGYNNKWFYAFITDCEWINNEVTEVHYVIDVIQSWLFETVLEPCFIERQHEPTDDLGDNLVPENFEIGDYLDTNWQPSGHLGRRNARIVVAATFDENGDPTNGGLYGYVYSGINYMSFPTTPQGVADCNAFLRTMSTKSEGIVSVFMAPGDFEPTLSSDRISPAVEYNITMPKYTSYGQPIYGFTPRNLKLLTYPYCFMYVTNFEGNTAIYPIEYFSDLANCTFKLVGSWGTSPEVALIPTEYKGMHENVDEMLTIGAFPQCSYNIDTFRAWLAHHYLPTSLNGNQLSQMDLTKARIQGRFSGLGSTLARSSMFAKGHTYISADTGEITRRDTTLGGLEAKIINGSGSQYTDWLSNTIRPQQAAGNQAPSVLYASGLKDFGFTTKHIRPEFAQRLDQYFDLFGYAQDKIAVPQRYVRNHWTYVKTRGCTVKGNIPASANAEICAIYDSGIRWYHYTAEVGRYDETYAQGNVPLGG